MIVNYDIMSLECIQSVCGNIYWPYFFVHIFVYRHLFCYYSDDFVRSKIDTSAEIKASTAVTLLLKFPTITDYSSLNSTELNTILILT